MKQYIEEALREYKPLQEELYYFKLAGEIKPKKIEAAIKHINKDLRQEDVIALCDTTVFGSGKEGFLLTADKIYSNIHDGGTHCTYAKGEGVSIKNLFSIDDFPEKMDGTQLYEDGYIYLKYDDGSGQLYYLRSKKGPAYCIRRMLHERLKNSAQALCTRAGKENDQEALRLLHLMADREHPKAEECVYFSLGVFYETGKCGLKKDLRKAFRYYMKAVEVGSYNALLSVFDKLPLYGTPKDEDAVVILLRRKHGRAYLNIGAMYMMAFASEEDVSEDVRNEWLEKGLDYYRRAVDRENDGEAAYRLWALYDRFDKDDDTEEADRLLKKAVELGDEKAKEALQEKIQALAKTDRKAAMAYYEKMKG